MCIVLKQPDIDILFAFKWFDLNSFAFFVFSFKKFRLNKCFKKVTADDRISNPRLLVVVSNRAHYHCYHFIIAYIATLNITLLLLTLIQRCLPLRHPILF